MRFDLQSTDYSSYENQLGSADSVTNRWLLSCAISFIQDCFLSRPVMILLETLVTYCLLHSDRYAKLRALPPEQLARFNHDPNRGDPDAAFAKGGGTATS